MSDPVAAGKGVLESHAGRLSTRDQPSVSMHAMEFDQMRGFTHLHVHSQFSLLSATPSLESLVARAKQDGYPALALTDRNVLYGAVKFDRLCGKHELQALIGMQVELEHEESGERPGELVLIAHSPDGYRSLSALSSRLVGDPQREAATLTWDELTRYRRGLVCIEAGWGGQLSQALRGGDTQRAAAHLARLAGVFQNQLFIGLERVMGSGSSMNSEVLGLAQRFGLPILALQPVYTMTEAEHGLLRLLIAIREQVPLADVRESALPGEGGRVVHWLNPREISTRYQPYPGSLEGVAEVLSRCGQVLPDGRPIWPVVKLDPGVTAAQALASRARSGLERKYGPDTIPGLNARLAGELASIQTRGYEALFLIVADIVRYARERGIPVSTRGSVANSLVAYSLGISTVDPVEHDLLFERFLNPARSDLPDIDLDFCSRRRDEVLAYVRESYGHEHMALVATVNSMGPRSAVREVAKAYGLAEARVKLLTKQLTRHWHPDPRRRATRSMQAALEVATDGLEREVLTQAQDLIGRPRYLGVHPGAIVITPAPCPQYVPVQMATKGYLTTQYDHTDLEAIGLPKIDLLGIRALTVLADAAAWIRKVHLPDFDPDDIPEADARTITLLQKGETIGVFQCESEGAQRTLRQLQVRSIRDLAVANAFFKPGPATGGMARAFVRRYRGEEPIAYLHPSLEPILGRTKGVLIFQEQILRLAREIAGLTWQEADQLRRGMSKFREQDMTALQTRFIEGCMRPPPGGPGLDRNQAGTLWEQVHAFAGYGFNQGHATAYAQTSYRMAYLKAHWPEAFMCARLAGRGGYHHPAVYLAEARRLGIKIQPPHVNFSGVKFTLTHAHPGDEAGQAVLWMGLGQVRDLRRRSIEAILAARSDADFESVHDVWERLTLQGRELEHLIQCGALDGLGQHRTAMLGQARAFERRGDQREFEFMQVPAGEKESDHQRLEWERQILGMPLSVHPLELVRDQLGDVTPLREVPTTMGGRMWIAGVRLPGWTGGRGFFLGDGDDFLIVKSSEPSRERKPGVWQPVRIHGAWRKGEWGGGWFQAEKIEAIASGAGLSR